MAPKPLVMAALVVAAQACAQPSFFTPIQIPLGLGNYVTSLIGADFNGDGRGDFAATFGISGAAVFLSRPDGTFKRENLTLPTGATAQFLAVADVNGDHIADLVGQGFIFLGNGDGTFQPAIQFTAQGRILGVADFNRDGLADLLIFNYNPGLAVQLGNGDGTFGIPGPRISEDENYEDFLNIAIADMNGDGFPDVLWSSGDGYVLPDVWLNNGDGTFRHAPPSPGFPLNIPSGYQFLTSGDLTGNGKTDIVEQGTGSLVVALGDGSGGLTYQATYPPIPSLSTLASPSGGPIALADFEGNGKIDIADYFYIYPGVGDGTFLPPIAFGQMLPAFGTPSYEPLLVAEDVNGDGKPDIVGVGPTNDSIYVLINASGTPVASATAHLAPTGGPTVAPGSIATIYGSDLSTTTASGNDTVLGNTSLEIFDYAGITFQPVLLYVSPTQINFIVPDAAAIGYAMINVLGNGLPRGANSTPIQPVAAGFFTANGLGTGAPAASAVSVAANGAQTGIPANPLTLPPAGQAYLSLYGTGFRHAASASCSLEAPQQNAKAVTPTYYGTQDFNDFYYNYFGVDQINIQIPSNTPKGSLNITCFFDGPSFPYASNTVTITIQ